MKITMAMVSFCLLGAAWATFKKVDASFHLNATTEVIAVRPTEGASLAFPLDSGLVQDVTGAPARIWSGTVDLNIENITRIVWIRVQSNPLKAVIEGKGVVVSLIHEGSMKDSIVDQGTIEFPPPAVGEIRHIPLDGSLVLGAFPPDGSGTDLPILLSGTVSMRGYSLFLKERSLFDAGRHELEPGEMFCLGIRTDCGDLASMERGRGFIRIGSEAGMQVVADWLGREAHVARSTGQGFSLAVSPFRRLAGDPFIAAGWIVIPLLWGISRILTGKEE